MPRVIHFVDGPFDGENRAVQDGQVMVSAFREGPPVPDRDQPPVEHGWYVIRGLMGLWRGWR